MDFHALDAITSHKIQVRLDALNNSLPSGAQSRCRKLRLMEDMVGLNRLSFWPKKKVSCANEEAPGSAFVAREAAEPQSCARKSAFPREEIKQKSLELGYDPSK